MEALGCADATDGYVDGGIDTWTAESMVAHACGVTLPRYENGAYVSLLDECGGHTQAYLWPVSTLTSRCTPPNRPRLI